MLRSKSILNWFNRHYENTSHRFTNLYHEYINFPDTNFIWKIKLKNGKIVQTNIHEGNLKTLQFATDYKWYAPAMATIENEILNYFNKDLTFVDVGANLGMRSMNALSRGIEVLMFEPNDEVSDLNLERCRLNKFDNYTFIRKGVSDKCATSSFFIDESSYKSSFHKIETTHFTKSVHIETTTLDNELKDHENSNLFIKVDVEGHETAVIEGAKTLIDRIEPTFLIEINDKGKNFNIIFSKLKDVGYSCFALKSAHADKNLLVPVTDIDSKKIAKSTDFLFSTNKKLMNYLKPYIND